MMDIILCLQTPLWFTFSFSLFISVFIGTVLLFLFTTYETILLCYKKKKKKKQCNIINSVKFCYDEIRRKMIETFLESIVRSRHHCARDLKPLLGSRNSRWGYFWFKINLLAFHRFSCKTQSGVPNPHDVRQHRRCLVPDMILPCLLSAWENEISPCLIFVRAYIPVLCMCVRQPDYEKGRCRWLK